MKEVFNELDLSSDTISLSLTDAAISIATSGNSGDVSHEIPAHSEIVSLFTFTAADPATATANSSAAVKYRYGKMPLFDFMKDNKPKQRN